MPTIAGPGSPTAGQVAAAGDAVVSSELKIGIIIGTIFVPLLGIILGVMYMNDALPEKKSVGRTWLYTGIGVIVGYCFIGGCMGMLAHL